MENEKQKKKPGCLVYLLAIYAAGHLLGNGITKVVEFYSPSPLPFQRVREIKEVRDINNDGLPDVTLGLLSLIEDKTETFFGTGNGYKTLEQIKQETRDSLVKKNFKDYKKGQKNLEKELQEVIGKYKK